MMTSSHNFQNCRKIFKTLENSQNNTNEVQKEDCIVFQNMRQTIPSLCLSLSIQGPGS